MAIYPRGYGSAALYAVHIVPAYIHPRKRWQAVTEQARPPESGPIRTVTSGNEPDQFCERDQENLGQAYLIPKREAGLMFRGAGSTRAA